MPELYYTMGKLFLSKSLNSFTDSQGSNKHQINEQIKKTKKWFQHKLTIKVIPTVFDGGIEKAARWAGFPT